MDYDIGLEEAIFTTARHMTEAGERERYILEACGADTSLMRRVRSLLRVLAENTSFLELPVETTVNIDQIYGDTEIEGSVIGPYELIEQIGAGGMGLVFLAQQSSPVRRQVALKIIRPGLDTREAVKRFEIERQVLAQLNHPNIARLLDAGTTPAGRPWFVMELAQGLPITNFCRQKSLPVSERLRLFESVCDAIDHAHQSGVLHRDIKPANVLVTVLNGRHVPKVIDFGVARELRPEIAQDFQEPAQDDSNLQVVVGTPAFMSPEQMCLPERELDARCDVYSLGMLLYEILTETPPYGAILWRNAGFTETRRVINTISPPLPSERLRLPAQVNTAEPSSVVVPENHVVHEDTKSSMRLDSQRLSSELKGDLDWITMKAIEKDRERRYDTVADLAADIRRFLNGEPVAAGPPSRLYRLKKLIRRHRSRFIIASLTLGLVVVFGIAGVTGWSLNRQQLLFKTQRELAHDEQRLSAVREAVIRDHRYANDMYAAFSAYDRGEIQQARLRLQTHSDSPEADARIGFEWHFLNRLCNDQTRTLQAGDGKVFDVEFSPDGRFLVSCMGGRNCSLRIWDVATGTLVHSNMNYLGDVNSACFSADGTLLLTGDETRRIRVLDGRTWNEIARLDGFKWPLGQIHLAGDNRTVIAAEIDWASRKSQTTVRDLQDPNKSRTIEGQRLLDVDEVNGVVAFASDQGAISLWTFPGVEFVKRLPDRLFGTCCGRFSVNGRMFAAGSVFNTSQIWNLSDSEVTSQPARREHQGTVRDIAFSADDRFIITALTSATLEIWDIASHSVQMVFHPKLGEAWSIGVAANNSTFASGYGNGNIQIHDWADVRSLRRSVIQSATPFQAVASDSECSRLAIIASDQLSINVYSSAYGQLLQSIAAPLDEKLHSVAFSADNRELWVANSGGELLRIDLTTSTIVSQTAIYPGPLLTPVVFHGGGLLATITVASGSCESGIWDMEARTELYRLPENVSGHSHSDRIWQFLNESSVLVGGSSTATRWNFRSGREIPPRIETPGKVIVHAAPVPGSDRALICCSDCTIELWDFAKKEAWAILEGHKSVPTHSAISPNGKTLATASYSGEVRLWHLATGQPLCELKGLSGEAMGLWFSADGKRLVAAAKTASGGSEIMVWDATLP